MILSQSEIREEVAAGRIVFDPPLEEKQWGEASVDLRLGFDFTKLEKADGAVFSVASGLGTIARSGIYSKRKLKADNGMGKPEKYELSPNEFVLALTHERITMPNHLIALVEGRSTYARVGLSMHQTAPWIQPGWGGQITLEIRNSGPLEIALQPLLDRPCQLTFFKLTSELKKEQAYGAQDGGRYQNQTAALPGSNG
jgi:dCTP deaminase